MTEPALHPSADQLRLLAETADETPVVMLNLLRYREEASDGSGRTGREAYRHYGELVVPMLEARGASVVVYATVDQTVIGPADEIWDEMILVRYPSRAAFLDMITGDDYLAAHQHREAGLADSRLIATTRVDGS